MRRRRRWRSYLELAQQQKAGESVDRLPVAAKSLNAGEHYAAAAALRARLALEGDAETGVTGPGDGSTVFDQTLSEGVKSYQSRHGLTADGKLTAATVTSLNVPMSDRVHAVGELARALALAAGSVP